MNNIGIEQRALLRTSLEQCLLSLEDYGLEPEMGPKGRRELKLN